MAEDPKASPEEQGNDGSGDPEPTKDEGTPAAESDTGKEKEAEKSPDEKPEGESESQERESEPEKKEEPTVDVSTIPLDKLLEREDLQRAIQSVSDKAVAKADRKRKQESRERREDERLKAEDEEYDELVADDDFEGIGKREAGKREKRKNLENAADELADAWVGELQKQYAPSLGEDAVEEVFQEVRQAGTGVTGYASALAKRQRDRELSALKEESAKSMADQIDAAVEAKLASKNLETRDKNTEEGKSASEEVSAKAKSKTSQTPTTDAEWEESYGEGETAFEELPEHIQDKYERVG